MTDRPGRRPTPCADAVPTAVAPPSPPATQPDPWQALATLTPARIALGRAGSSLPTQAQLRFALDHALARDAVRLPLDRAALAQAVAEQGLTSLSVHSRAADRAQYVQRPDLGRRLDAASVRCLDDWRATADRAPDVALVLADGLSSTAVQAHGAALVAQLSAALAAAGWSMSPVCLVAQGRVAIGDEVGERLGARSTVMIVGERPGLSAPDSLGLYYTYAPRVGLTDAGRNCVSNIRPCGLPLAEAARRAVWLVRESFRYQRSGVLLKDASGPAPGDGKARVGRNFLLD